mgnify:CR=1 FL=1
MEQQKVDQYMMTNAKYFPEEKIVYVKEKLRTMDESKFSLITTIPFKDPTTIFVVSLFLGVFGIDRFMLGDTGKGIGKLCTLGGCGIWAFIDLFAITKQAKECNFNKLMTLL